MLVLVMALLSYEMTAKRTHSCCCCWLVCLLLVPNIINHRDETHSLTTSQSSVSNLLVEENAFRSWFRAFYGWHNCLHSSQNVSGLLQFPPSDGRLVERWREFSDREKRYAKKDPRVLT